MKFNQLENFVCENTGHRKLLHNECGGNGETMILIFKFLIMFDSVEPFGYISVELYVFRISSGKFYNE